MLAFSVRQGVLHLKGEFELALCGAISSLEVLEWFVKDLVLVFVNSFVPGMATVLLHGISMLSPVGILFMHPKTCWMWAMDNDKCVTVMSSNNLRYAMYLI